ncbi:hypothetical protein FKM82_009712 [Ascaphus truei]
MHSCIQICAEVTMPTSTKLFTVVNYMAYSSETLCYRCSGHYFNKSRRYFCVRCCTPRGQSPQAHVFIAVVLFEFHGLCAIKCNE